MIRTIPHRDFKKDLKRLNKKEIQILEERVRLFVLDPMNPVLNNHSLRGTYTGYRSINITGDLRLVYEVIGEGIVMFVAIDSHSKLYG